MCPRIRTFWPSALVMPQWGDAHQPVTVEADGRRVTFAGYCFIRLHPDRVEAWGDLRHLRMPGLPRESQLVLKHHRTRVVVQDRVLTFGAPPATQAAP